MSDGEFLVREIWSDAWLPEKWLLLGFGGGGGGGCVGGFLWGGRGGMGVGLVLLIP